MSDQDQYILKKINLLSKFSDVVFKNAREERFGITHCCPLNLDELSIEKELCDWEEGKFPVYTEKTYTESEWEFQYESGLPTSTSDTEGFSIECPPGYTYNPITDLCEKEECIDAIWNPGTNPPGPCSESEPATWQPYDAWTVNFLDPPYSYPAYCNNPCSGNPELVPSCTHMIKIGEGVMPCNGYPVWNECDCCDEALLIANGTLKPNWNQYNDLELITFKIWGSYYEPNLCVIQEKNAHCYTPGCWECKLDTYLANNQIFMSGVNIAPYPPAMILQYQSFPWYTSGGTPGSPSFFYCLDGYDLSPDGSSDSALCCKTVTASPILIPNSPPSGNTVEFDDGYWIELLNLPTWGDTECGEVDPILGCVEDTTCILFEVLNQNGDPVEGYVIYLDGGNVGTTNEYGHFRIDIENASVDTQHIVDFCHCFETTGQCSQMKITLTVTEECPKVACIAPTPVCSSST